MMMMMMIIIILGNSVLSLLSSFSLRKQLTFREATTVSLRNDV